MFKAVWGQQRFKKYSFMGYKPNKKCLSIFACQVILILQLLSLSFEKPYNG